MNTVENDLKLAEGVANEIKGVITPLKYADDEWSTTVAAFIDQAFEHHAAIVLLIRSALFGSAFVLLRSLVEIVVRGVWIAAGFRHPASPGTLRLQPVHGRLPRRARARRWSLG